MFVRPVFLCVLIFISNALCAPQLCKIKDLTCLIEVTNFIYSTFVPGLPGVESSDPIHVDLIEANLPTIKYTLSKASLYGMKDCAVEFVEMIPSTKKYKYNLACPHLTMTADYELKGTVGDHYLEGQGPSTVEYYDYHYYFSGDYEPIDTDGQVHLNLKNVKVDIEAKGKVVFDYKQLYNGDKEKSDAAHKYMNENWKFVDEVICQPTGEAFMKKFIANAQAYLNTVSIKDLFEY